MTRILTPHFTRLLLVNCLVLFGCTQITIVASIRLSLLLSQYARYNEKHVAQSIGKQNNININAKHMSTQYYAASPPSIELPKCSLSIFSCVLKLLENMVMAWPMELRMRPDDNARQTMARRPAVFLLTSNDTHVIADDDDDDDVNRLCTKPK